MSRGAEGDPTGSARRALSDHRPSSPGAWLAVVAAVALAGRLWTLHVAASGPAAGLFHDGGVYLATAQALARGDGYRMVGTPGAPPAMRYPPVYPLALATVARLAPRFPDDLPLLKGVALLAAVGLIVALPLTLPALGIPPDTAVATALLTAAAPVTMTYATAIASELPFALIATLAVWACERAVRRARWTAAAGAGALAGLAFLTRSVGVAVVAAGAVVLLRRADRRRALAFALAAAPAIVAWGAWLALQRGAVGTPGYAAALAHDGVPGPATLLEHVVTLPAAVGLVTLPGVAEMLPDRAPWLAALAVYLVGAGVLVAALRQRFAAYVTATLAIAVAVPWFQPRFLVPLAPLLLASLLAAPFAPAAPAARRRVGLVIVAVLLVLGLRGSAVRLDGARVSGLPSLEGGSYPAGSWRAVAQTIAWLDAHTSRDDVLAGFQDPLLYLYTGRRAVQAYPSLWRPGEADLTTALDGTGARYLVDIPPPATGVWSGSRVAWNGWVADHRDALGLVYEDAAADIRVWRLDARAR